MKNLYTLLFEFMDGTYVSQLEAESEDELIEFWLAHLKKDLLGHGKVTYPKNLKTVMDYLNSQIINNDLSFEDQIRADLGQGERLGALTSLENTFCSTFMIELTTDLHDKTCSIIDEALWEDFGSPGWEAPKWDEDDCPRCRNDKLGELYVVKTVRKPITIFAPGKRNQMAKRPSSPGWTF